MTRSEIAADNAGELSVRTGPAYGKVIAVVLALMGVGLACALAPFANGKPLVAVALAAFPVILIALLGLPVFQSLRLGPRILLVLLALRPLVDASTTVPTASPGSSLTASSGPSLQVVFAAVFGFLLLAVWVESGHRRGYTSLPNIFLLILLGLTALAWMIGGLGGGTLGCARTAWGLLVALLLGSMFRTEKQIDIFARSVFYSSIFFFLILCFNMGSGFQAGQYWRLGGQYTFWAILAAVAFSFFVFGLYVFGRAQTLLERLFSLSLLLLLGVVIILTQNRTMGGLMLLSVCLYLWASKRRWLLFGVTVPLLVFLFAFTADSGWRLVSSFSLANGHVSGSVLTLTGRIYLWGDWLKTYMGAGLFHEIFGLGWGVVFRDYLSMGVLGTSITENSFLWFLVGTGALGLVVFSSYLFWVLFKAWNGWRKGSSKFQKQFSLLTFMAVLTFVIEGFTTDLAISPDANVYLYAVMSIFVFHYLRITSRRSPRKAADTVPEEMQSSC